MQARAWFLRVARCLNQSQLRRMDARKNPLNARGFQPEHALEQPGKHGTIVGQNRIVAVLKKVCLLDFDLFAENTAAIDAAAQYPVDAAVAVIGAAVAVLPKGAAKFGDHDHHRIAPSRSSNLFRKTCKRTSEFAEAVGEISRRRPLIDMGVPAADIDKTEVELLAHQAADTPRRQLEAARRNRAAIGRGHLFGYRFVDIVPNPESLRNRSSNIASRVHLLHQPVLPTA